MPLAYYPGMSAEDYKTMLAKLIAWKRWKMGYFYLFSTGYGAYVSSCPVARCRAGEALAERVWGSFCGRSPRCPPP